MDEDLLPKVSKKNGIPGMDLWKVLVLGIMHQVCNCVSDKLYRMSNNSRVICELLGHSSDYWSDSYFYELQTIKDTV